MMRDGRNVSCKESRGIAAMNWIWDFMLFVTYQTKCHFSTSSDLGISKKVLHVLEVAVQAF